MVWLNLRDGDEHQKVADATILITIFLQWLLGPSWFSSWFTGDDYSPDVTGVRHFGKFAEYHTLRKSSIVMENHDAICHIQVKSIQINYQLCMIVFNGYIRHYQRVTSQNETRRLADFGEVAMCSGGNWSMDHCRTSMPRHGFSWQNPHVLRDARSVDSWLMDMYGVILMMLIRLTLW